MGTALKLGVLVVIAISLALYARGKLAEPDEPVRTARVSALTLTPQPVAVAIEGTIVFEQSEPFVLYGEAKEDGSSSVKTKRLVFPASYACTAGDIPCSFTPENPYPFLSGDHVRIEGVAEADVLYVASVAIRS